MRYREKFRCDRVRKNNGIIEVFFSRRVVDQDEHAIFNIVAEPADYEVGKEYWLSIDPAFPH